MNKEGLKTTLVSIGIVLIILIIGLIGVSISEKKVTTSWNARLQDYQSFTVQGITYKTEDVETLDYKPLSYEDDIIVFEMKNGDTIYTIVGGIIWHK